MQIDLSTLPDETLLARLSEMTRRERRLTRELVAHIAEVDRRQLYLQRGLSSMHGYCIEVLHLSDDVAYKRIQVARAARQFPAILDSVQSGAVHVTGLRLLVPHLTEANYRDVLARARHKTTREIERLVVELAPKEDAAPTIRKLPQPRTVAAPQSPAVEPPALERAPAPRPADRPIVEPLAPTRFRVQFTADEQLLALIQEAQDLERHQIPNGDLAQVMRRALEQRVKELRRRKYAETEAPRKSAPPKKGSRRIPSSTKRAVFERDKGQCTFQSVDGRRCRERGMLEFHHIEPFARGGPSTPENVTLRCRSHNQHQARLDFGPLAGLKTREPSSGQTPI